MLGTCGARCAHAACRRHARHARHVCQPVCAQSCPAAALASRSPLARRDLDAAAAAIQKGKTCAVFVEPIQASMHSMRSTARLASTRTRPAMPGLSPALRAARRAPPSPTTAHPTAALPLLRARAASTRPPRHSSRACGGSATRPARCWCLTKCRQGAVEGGRGGGQRGIVAGSVRRLVVPAARPAPPRAPLASHCCSRLPSSPPSSLVVPGPGGPGPHGQAVGARAPRGAPRYDDAGQAAGRYVRYRCRTAASCTAASPARAPPVARRQRFECAPVGPAPARGWPDSGCA